MELEESRSGRGGRRQRFSVEQKRQMVEATLAPGASVARVAREHGVNAHQVFAWRGFVQAGLACGPRRKWSKAVAVHIATTDEVDSCATAPTQRAAGSINLEFPGKALVTIEGSPDRESLRLVLRCLLR